MPPKHRVLKFDDKNAIHHIKKQAKHRSGNEVAKVHCDADTILRAHEFIDVAKSKLEA